MKVPAGCGFAGNPVEGEKKRIDSELWHACAGPLVSLPPVGSLVVYFPQGHSEQVAASMQKESDSIPNYPSLPSKLICVLLDVTLHADAETDEVYAQMTLQPANKYDRDALLASEMGLKQNKQPAEFFCKTLTASDTSTHGGFSVPRRAAEKIFPPLDFAMQPPAQELVAKDLHDVPWTFRHIYRGQPKRHLLTTGWSVFVSTKRLSAGDSVLFIRDEKSQLLLGIRRANRQQPALSSSVLSSDSMHIGILAAAAHAATNNSPFTIFYNPRASPSEFVIPLAKYNKAMYTQVSLGMRFRMLFEMEDSGVRRYMGTVTGISDLDPVQWKNSLWRNLQVGWDESTANERRTRVSIWEIEPVASPFYLCPPPFFRPKFPKIPGFPDEYDVENAFQRVMPWLNDDISLKDTQGAMFPGLSLAQWMAMQQNSQRMASPTQSSCLPTSIASTLHEVVVPEDAAKMLNFQAHAASAPNLNPKLPQTQPLNQTLPPPHQLQQQIQLPSVPAAVSSTHQLQSPVLQQNTIHLQQQQFQQQEQLPQHQSQQLKSVAKQEAADQKLMQQQHQAAGGQILPQNHLSSQHLQTSNPQQQGLQCSGFSSLGSLHPSPLPPILQAQQPLEYQQSLLQKQQEQLQQLMQPQLQIQLLQKLQQQQLLSQLQQQQSQLQQQLTQQNQQFQEQQDFQPNLDASKLLPLQSKQPHQPQFLDNQKSPALARTQSSLSGTNGPSSSNFTSTNSHVASLGFHGKAQQGPAILVEEAITPSMDNLLQEFQMKPQVMVKQELQNSKELGQLPNQLSVADQLDASSTTSFCVDGSGHEGLSLPPNCLDSNDRDQRDNFLLGTNTMPDALLSRGLDMGKDIQNLISGFGQQKDVETELSTADISSQSFGVPDISFNPGCSTDVVVNDGVLSRGVWTNQPPRMRTYTKVQKRGSVGRCIDVTRYKGYSELRRDLARMFAIEGQLEDSHGTEWKLVYVDHEKDMLLVGDDPWEEFISCVHSIKILSAVEVQQMSLDGNLTSNLSVRNEACSGSTSGNVWRGQFDDASFASFHH